MTTNLTYIIADDDAVYRELTLQQLSLIPNLQCMAVCDSAVSVSHQLQNLRPDLLILDVEMPGLSGIELAKSLTVLPMIIFISSHSNYAADAFEIDALDYLVKPVAPHRILRAVEKARHLQEMKSAVPASEAFKNEDDDAFFIKDKSSFIRISYTDVLYIESLGDFVNIFLQTGEKKIALVNLKSLEQQLPETSFVRISRTHMINRHKITAIDSSTVMLGKIQLPIGKTYSDNVIQQIIGSKAIKRFI
jgi:DNA-binding LytR/AlgR family response regulator